jgi:hypothetical protein
MNSHELRTRTVASVEGNTAGAQDSQTRVHSVHGDHSADTCFVHSAGRLSTEKGALSTYGLPINDETGNDSPQRSPVIDRLLTARNGQGH